MKRSENIDLLAAALAKAQGAMEGAKKDSENPFFKSKYADLASVVAAIKEPFSSNGLAYTQGLEYDETGAGAILVVTLLMHSSGQWVESRIGMKPTKNDPQGIGSTITYARRYALQSLAGIPAEDDDGNAGSAQSTSAPAARPAAAAIKRDEGLKLVAAKAVASAVGTIPVNDAAEVFQSSTIKETIDAMDSMAFATKGVRMSYKLHGDRVAIVDGELLAAIGSMKSGAPTPAWLEHVVASDKAWPIFCKTFVKIQRELGIGVEA